MLSTNQPVGRVVCNAYVSKAVGVNFTFRTGQIRRSIAATAILHLKELAQ